MSFLLIQLAAEGENAVWDRERLVPALVALFVGVVIGVAGTSWNNQLRPSPIVIIPPEPTPLPEPTGTPGPVRVFVSGAVSNPAVYELPPDSIVEAAVAAAGGFADEADTAVVNLAQPLADGAQVYIPSRQESPTRPAAGVNGPEPLLASAAETTGRAGLININTASVAELVALPGIGPATAESIVTHRESRGPFTHIEAIMDVSGIGPARFDQIKELITVEGE